MNAVATATCQLCELPLGSDPASPFCCIGCANVYTILSESGLLAGDFRQSELYRQSLKLGLIANAPALTGAAGVGAEKVGAEETGAKGTGAKGTGVSATGGRAAGAVTPSPSSRGREAGGVPDTAPTADTREALYHLSGLWCTACGWLIEHALLKERGVVSAEVVFTSDLLKVTFCPQYLVDGRIAERVASLGYRAERYTGETRESDSERRDLLLRFGVAGALWMNVMLFSLVVYASYFGKVADWAGRGVPMILGVLAAPVVFYSGWPILRIAAHGLRHGTIRMETLISSGILAAYGYSLTQIGRGGHHFYFDTACAIVTLVLAGKVLERGAKEKTARSLSLLHRQMPNKARIWVASGENGGRERFVSIDAIQPGMTLLVKSGERVPADAVVIDGHSTADESLITGESVPCEKAPGDAVIGGSVNGSGILEVRVTRAAAESTLAQIVKAVETAVASRTEIERLADRLSRAFIPVVMLLALATFGFAWYTGVSGADAMLRAIAVLVIACPCALGIATPLATTAAIGAASRAGILVRDGRVLEAARKLDVMLLDKTGTVTEGNFRLHEAWWSPEWSDGGIELAAAVEAYSEHLLGRAIVRYANERGVSNVQPCRDVIVEKGRGISGWAGGHAVRIGNRGFAAKPLDAGAARRVDAWEREGLTVVYCWIDGELAGMLALGDRIRPDARVLVEALHVRGVRVVLLSGDAVATTSRIAEQLGADEFLGEVSPALKAEVVGRFKKATRRVAMVGDGINDAPALAAADLGIAMGSGTDLAMHSAPLVLMSDSLMKIPAAMDLARRTHRVIRQNLFWALFYNTAGIAFAALGVLNPLMAAGAMVLSSLSVVANSMRLGRR